MEGARLGPYRLLSALGAGGMGTVYLARVEEAAGALECGALVAVKVVHPHLLARAGLVRRFVREARLGARIQHENVVTTLDADTAEVEGRQLPYLVMEHVEGETLRHLLSRLGVVPESLLRALAAQVAAGLTAIHEAGIVHRDIKPENVLVTKDHHVRIMDLGVARLVAESSAVSDTGQFAGSLLYAAPEQFGREEVGPAADLYALGAMLYELAAGDSPFRRPDPAGVIRAHLEEPVPHVRERNPEVSPFLQDLISVLLARRPADRPPSAAFVREVLVGGERSPWWTERERRRPASGAARPRVPVRRETALHGRDEALATLSSAWDEARAGRGGVVLVEGEAGIGKSRLVDAFLARIEDEDAAVLYGSYPPGGGPGGLSQAVLDHFGPERLEATLAERLGVARTLAPAFAAAVRHEQPPPGTEPLGGDALQAVNVYLMRGLAEERPLLWVVDDLHFAGPDSRRVLLAMARAAGEHRVLLLVTTRPGLARDELADLARAPGFRRLTLDRLTPRQVIELLQDAFRSQLLAERLGGKIAYKSDGVPFFVFEMIRSLRDGHLLERRSDGAYATTRVVEEIEVPSAVRDLIEGRMARLTAEERAVLDVGAVQGFAFDAEIVARVLERGTIPVLQALAELERRYGLVRAEGRRIRFDHHQVQEVLYAAVPEPLRAAYHAAVADALVEREAASGAGAVAGEVAAQLATHHLRGSRPSLALPYLDAALAHLEASHRNEALVDLVRRALAEPGLVEGARRVSLLLRGADRLAYLGRRGEEAALCEEAMRLAQASGEPALRARAGESEGWRLMRSGRYADAGERFAQSVAAAEEAGAPEVAAAATRGAGVVLYLQARHDAARQQLERAVGRAHALDDVRLEANAVGALGVVLRALGRHEEALAHLERHREMTRACGDRRGEMNALGNLANIEQYRGRLDEAWALYGEALRIAREIGDRLGEAAVAGSMAGVHWLRGHVAEAVAGYEETLVLDREIGNVDGEARMLLNLGEAWIRLGAPEAAREHLEGALRICRGSGSRILEAHALMRLGTAAVQRGAPAEAEAPLLDAIQVLRKVHGGSPLRVALDALGAARLASGDVAGARAPLEEAAESARQAGDHAVLTSSLCRLARLGLVEASEAEAAFARCDAAMSAFARLELRHLLAQATGAPHHRNEARRLLDDLVGHAPERWRTPMRDAVKTHREIGEA